MLVVCEKKCPRPGSLTDLRTHHVSVFVLYPPFASAGLGGGEETRDLQIVGNVEMS